MAKPTNGARTRFLALAIVAFIACGAEVDSKRNFQEQRTRMVAQQIAARGVRDQAVLDAMRAVPRHLFIPTQWQDEAYDDHPVPIGYEQTISQPYIVAYMTEALRAKKGSKILEIRKHGITKGRAVEDLIARRDWDFLLAMGDDYTDEEMFAAMPENSYSIKVGSSFSRARFNVDTVQDVRSLLNKLTGC